jgi:peptide/nickel transport system permease protein
VLRYTFHRLLIMIPTLLVISFISFAIIKLPPGDFLSNQIAELQSQGDKAALDKVDFLRKQYGLDKPFIEQYAVWVGLWPGDQGFSGLLEGDLGWSFEHDMAVKDIVGDRLLLSFILNFSVVLFT